MTRKRDHHWYGDLLDRWMARYGRDIIWVPWLPEDGYNAAKALAAWQRVIDKSQGSGTQLWRVRQYFRVDSQLGDVWFCGRRMPWWEFKDREHIYKNFIAMLKANDKLRRKVA